MTNKDILIGTVSTLAGIGIGWGLCYWRMKKKFNDMLDAEVAELKDSYRPPTMNTINIGEKLMPDGQKAKLEKLVEQMLTRMEYKSDSEDDTEDDTLDLVDGTENQDDLERAVEVDRNAFDQTDENDPYAPYIITVDDFNDTHLEYSKISICWYEKDETLADDQDEIVDDPDSLIGPDAVNEFGNGSGDPELVYVRNNRISTDFEIVKNRGSFAEIVYAMHPERKPHKKTPRMKDEE